MTPETRARATVYADLAQVTLIAAREIRLREQNASEAIPLTASNAQVMRYIDANPGATPSETAAATGLLRSNLSAAIRELEHVGFVERRRDHTDGRGYRLYATAAAARGLAAIQEQWASAVESILGSDEGLVEAIDLLRRLADGLAVDRHRVVRGSRRSV